MPLRSALVVSLSLLFVSPIAAFAQAPAGPHQMVQPEPMEASHPRAKQAAALVQLILAGDRAAVIKVLQSDGSPVVQKSPDLGEVVDKQIARLANKGYAIAEFMTGLGADVVVQLAGGREGETNIVIRFTPEAPHRIDGFGQAHVVQGDRD